MQECPHSDYLTVSTCTICLHGLPEAKPPRPEDWWIEPHHATLEVDPGEALIEAIMSGSVCSRCFTPREPLGCSCSRLKVGQQDWDEAVTWLETIPDVATELGIKFTETEAAHVAGSVQKRILRRLDLTEDQRADEVSGMKKQFGIEPKWFPPRNTEPTHLPI